MNDLQWALLVSSVVAVGGVWAFNLWQERKHRQATERLFARGPDDALLAGRAENSTGDQADEAATDQLTASADGVANEVSASDALTEPEAENSFAPWADPISDCLVRFEIAAGVAAPAIWAAQSTWASALTKPLRYLAREDAAAAWKLVEESDTGRYSHWLAALQLADRNGAVSDRELVVFFDGLQQLANQLGTSIAVPSRTDTLLKAQQLDEFCASVDIQFSFHLVESQGGAFVGTKLRGVCEAAGLALQVDGCFHAASAAGTTEYRLRNSGSEALTIDSLRSLATNNVTLILDVPLVADGVAAFDRLVGTARQLERGLGGKLVDAQGAAVADELILGIRTKIGELQRLMTSAGIDPGGALAAKLFN